MKTRRAWMKRTHFCMMVPAEIDLEARRLWLSASALLKLAWKRARGAIRRLR